MKSAKWLILTLLLTRPLFASTVISESLEDMTAHSSVVIRGTVTHISSVMPENSRMIRTRVDITIKEIFKGPSRKTMTLDLPGGVTEKLSQHVDGVPTFVEGEDVVVFAEPQKTTSFFALRSLAASKVVFRRSPTNERIAARDLTGLAFAMPNGTKPILQQTSFGTETQFISRLKTAVKKSSTRETR